MSDFLRQLAGGDRRSIGAADAVVKQVLAKPALLSEIVEGLSHSDYLIRMRCADVAEKLSLAQPALLQRHKAAILALAGEAREKEMRWHYAQMLPRLDLSTAERRTATALMLDYFNDTSRIVQTWALNALAAFARDDARLRARLLPLIEEASRTSSPAVRARARKLLAQLAP